MGNISYLRLEVVKIVVFGEGYSRESVQYNSVFHVIAFQIEPTLS